MHFATMIARSKLPAHLSAMLAEPAMHPLGHIRYRHHADNSTALPFHQHPHHDAGGELTLERVRMVNVLIPFTAFDGNCADMEYVAKATTTLLPVTESPETQFATFELDKRPILEAYAKNLWRPRVEVGDILVFRDGTLHRTFHEAGMKRQRTSIDLRVFDARDPLSVYHGSPGFRLPDLAPVTAD